MSDSVPPHPWDSPGKNTGLGCHFLLQRIKVKRESEVAQSCLTLHNPMDCSLPGSSVHGIFQARVLEWGAIAFSKEVTSWRQWDCIASAVGPPDPGCLWDCLLGGTGCGALICWVCFPLTEGSPEAVWLSASHFGCFPVWREVCSP